MPHRQRFILAAALLLLVAPPSGPPAAVADPVVESWGPIVGGGYAYPDPYYQFVSITTDAAWLTVGFDPDNPGQGYIDLSLGVDGFAISSDGIFTESALGDSVEFSSMYGLGGEITVGLTGELSDPASLTAASVEVTPSYHDLELTFYGQQAIVPEPSGLLTLALGVGGVALSFAGRRSPRRIGA